MLTLPNARCIKPWRYSLHGFDVNNAAEGAELTLPDSLLADGIISGHLEPLNGGKKSTNPVTEDKSDKRRRARKKGGQYQGDDPSTPDVNEAYEE